MLRSPDVRAHRLPAAHLAVATAAILFGTTYVPGQRALEDLSAAGFVTIRFAVAAMVMLPFVARRSATTLEPAGRPGPYLVGGAIGGACLFTLLMLQSAALTLTTAGNVAFLGSLAVVLVPLLTAVVTRRAPSGFVIVGTLLAVVGACFLTGATLAIGAGDALALISAFGVALHIMSIGYFAPRLSPARYNFVQFAVVTAAAAVVATISGFGHVTTGAVAVTAACGVVQAVGLALQVTGQRRISATSSALILMLIPLTGAALDVLVNGVSLSPLATLGAVLVLGSVVVGELLPGRASGRRAGSASGRRAGSASGRRAGSASGRRAGSASGRRAGS